MGREGGRCQGGCHDEVSKDESQIRGSISNQEDPEVIQSRGLVGLTAKANGEVEEVVQHHLRSLRTKKKGTSVAKGCGLRGERPTLTEPQPGRLRVRGTLAHNSPVVALKDWPSVLGCLVPVRVFFFCRRVLGSIFLVFEATGDFLGEISRPPSTSESSSLESMSDVAEDPKEAEDVDEEDSDSDDEPEEEEVQEPSIIVSS